MAPGGVSPRRIARYARALRSSSPSRMYAATISVSVALSRSIGVSGVITSAVPSVSAQASYSHNGMRIMIDGSPVRMSAHACPHFAHTSTETIHSRVIERGLKPRNSRDVALAAYRPGAKIRVRTPAGARVAAQGMEMNPYRSMAFVVPAIGSRALARFRHDSATLGLRQPRAAEARWRTR